MRRPITVDRHDFRSEAARNVQPVNAFFEERVAAGHALVVAPVVGALQPLRDRGEVRKYHVADRAFGEQLSQDDRERFVVIVFANEHDTLRLVARVDGRAVVLHARKGGLLDEHMFTRASARSVRSR